MIDLLFAVRFQGWENFFNCLQGPIYFNLIKDFQIHVTYCSFQVMSFVFGKKMVIYEKLIDKLINHDGSGIRCEQIVEKDSNINEMSKVVFSSGKNSSKIKDLFPHLKVQARILLGCVNLRPATNSSNYISDDHQYILYQIESGKKVNLPALLLRNLKSIVIDTKNGSKRTKSYIPLCRLISYILMQSKLIDSLIDDQFT